MYFHSDDEATVRWLASVLTTAAQEGQTIRLRVLSNGSLMVKRGGSVWSVPIDSTFDLSRDIRE